MSFTICASERDGRRAPTRWRTRGSPDGCPDSGNTGEHRRVTVPNDDYQILLGVPGARRAPGRRATFTDPEPRPPAGGPLTFTAQHRYTRELTESCAAAGGLRVGRIHLGALPHDDGADDTPGPASARSRWTSAAAPAVGRDPFAGPFRIRPVVGGRSAARPRAARRPAATTRLRRAVAVAAPARSSVCIDSPDSAGHRRPTSSFATTRPRDRRRRGHGQPGPDGAAPVQRQPQRHAPRRHDVLGRCDDGPAGGDASHPSPTSFTPRRERQHADHRAGRDPEQRRAGHVRRLGHGQPAERPDADGDVQAHGPRPPEAGRLTAGDQAQDAQPAGALDRGARTRVVPPQRGGHDDLQGPALPQGAPEGQAHAHPLQDG